MSRHRRLDCKVCGGYQTVSVSRGRKVETLAQCFKCHASYKDLAIAFGWPLEKKARRPHHPPPFRGTLIERAIQELVDTLENRREKLLAKLPSVDWFEMNAQVRHEVNMARELRSLVRSLGPDPEMAWAFAEEACQRDQRARSLILELDRQLSEQNAIRQALVGAEVTT
jgi:hypothetical protein